MRLLFKIYQKIFTINNISVDDKCLPLIGGVHPYSSKNESSPLVREAALWFKTLALDTIYVDCDRCLIYWVSIENDVGPEVVLRRQENSKKFVDDFIPSSAKPLFEDLTLYDFDPSLKEMMGKCVEVAEKLNKNAIPTTNLNSKVANLLHVYILPSVQFTHVDLYALSLTRCLIEERLMRADSDISNKAKEKNLLDESLNNLKENLINSYNFESETYLRSCDPDFLKIFLRKIEYDSQTLNLTLEARQSSVNWAKDHPNEYRPEDVCELQKKRNEVHKEVERLIIIRECLRNVVTRKEKCKSKKSKKTRLQKIDSCFQSIYIEINRRWELDNKTMDRLILDKVNISGAREATLSAIIELGEVNRNSDRSTRFEPADFGHCQYDDPGKAEKPSNWLTLQERISNILEGNSESSKAFSEGCTLILSQIDLALSEFDLANSVGSSSKASLDVDRFKRLSVSPTMRTDRLSSSRDSRNWRNGFVLEEKDTSSDPSNNNNQVQNSPSDATASTMKCNGDTEIIVPSQKDDETRHSPNVSSDQTTPSVELRDVEMNSRQSTITGNYVEDHYAADTGTAKQLSMKCLMQAIDNMKTTVREHFREVVKCLQKDLETIDWSEDTVVVDMYVDQRELIWKAYERLFSERVLPSLTQLYGTYLTPGITNTYDALCTTSLQDLLEGDKILSLFFNNDLDSTAANKKLSLFRQKKTTDSDRYSMARTVSNFSINILDCSVKELYDIANADSGDVFKRFQFEEEEDGASVVLSSSSESGASVKMADLFGDEEDDENENPGPSTRKPMVGEEEEGFPKRGENDSAAVLAGSGTVFIPETGGPSVKFLSAQDSTIKADASSEFDSSRSSYYSHSGSEPPPPPLLSFPVNKDGSGGVSHAMMDRLLTPFCNHMRKCIRGKSILDKVRYLSKAIEGLNRDVSKLYGAEHQSACDDIITMLIMALSQMPPDIFVGLYVNLNMLIDALPKFLSGSLCDYNLVSLVASYDFLKNRNTMQTVVRADRRDSVAN